MFNTFVSRRSISSTRVAPQLKSIKIYHSSKSNIDINPHDSNQPILVKDRITPFNFFSLRRLSNSACFTPQSNIGISAWEWD